ncbi:MAG: hypothetical protein M3083_04610 [Actinomycetota bacterium]|nr:hypothetical protein [Actinomycetota bacterium]
MTKLGGIFVTGHDPDYHAHRGGNTDGARHMIQRAVDFVTFGNPSPRMLLVTDLRDPGGDQIDSRLGLSDAGFTYDVADFGSGTAGTLDLHTVDFRNYDCVVVASDYGGWLHQDELDILNARSSELLGFVNQGGGIVALDESGNRPAGAGVYPGTSSSRFGFIPFVVAELSLHQSEAGFTVTPAGLSMGLVDSDVNGNVSHSVFTKTGGMDPVDLDSSHQILSLAKRGVRVGPGGVGTVMWLDHLDLRSGDDSVTTSFNSTTSGVGGGLSGLVIESSTTGDIGNSGGIKVVSMALEVPPGFTVEGVRICYELSSAGSFIDQVRLAQVQDPPSSAVVLLDDPTALTDPGPICVDSAMTSIDPAAGALLLDLRVNFGDPADRIVVRGLGLHLLPKP